MTDPATASKTAVAGLIVGTVVRRHEFQAPKALSH